jgi:hypothetical protein
MKMRAGCQLWTRNPSAIPATIAATRVAEVGIASTSPLGWLRTANRKKAIAAIAATPAASPSSPSMRLTALIIATSARIVSGSPRSATAR